MPFIVDFRPRAGLCRATLLVLSHAAACNVSAVPLVPARDDQIIERLGPRASTAPERAAAAASPLQAAQAARRLIELARGSGDPRPAGQALALLRPWADDRNAPAPVIVMLATTEQYLHEFGAAATRLEALLSRDAAQPQAWLTLATIRRVQGRYEDSDAACRGLQQAGKALHAQACRAENEALRGRHDTARTTLARLLASTAEPGTRNWLFTTLAELEERAGRPTAAEAAYRSALAAGSDTYTVLAYADFLIAAGRGAEAGPLLERQPRSDAALLRLAAALPNEPAGRAAASELRQRFDPSAQRPGAQPGHARELAMFELWVERDAQAALEHARLNLTRQREPVDVLLLSRAAQAGADAAALAEAKQIAAQIGLVDRRLDAVR